MRSNHDRQSKTTSSDFLQRLPSLQHQPLSARCPMQHVPQQPQRGRSTQKSAPTARPLERDLRPRKLARLVRGNQQNGCRHSSGSREINRTVLLYNSSFLCQLKHGKSENLASHSQMLCASHLGYFVAEPENVVISHCKSNVFKRNPIQ